MNKNVTVSLVILGICIAFAFYIGTWFGSDADQVNLYKHKYDSALSLIKIQRNIMIDNEKIKEKLRATERSLKFKQDSIKDAAKQQYDYQERIRIQNIERWRNSTEAQLADEMNRQFEQAHPAPLFDTAQSIIDVKIKKQVAIHFLDVSEQLNQAKFNIKTVEVERDIALSRVENLLELDRKHRIDSAAQAVIITTNEGILGLKDQELADEKKAHKKALRREKVQKWVAVGTTIIMTYLAISASQ